MTTRQYHVPDISCDHCKHAIEAAVSAVGGVGSVEVTVATKTVRVEGSSDDRAVRAAIGAAGFDIE
ncbi:MAG: copper chaperone [Acidimicrobiaceae bacterium]|nr:copper chaperone [Acidimicrobiaceae bacterium]MDQ1365665.1 copper chaperone [Acidimicrobiaceae bacterium]